MSGPASPECAKAFLGVWQLESCEGYSEFLSECVGLSTVSRKLAENVYPYPRFKLNGDGELECETALRGAYPVVEIIRPGQSTLPEPNLGVEYQVEACWEGEVYVTVRTADSINGGKPTTQRRWVDAETGKLHIVQDWGGAVKFVAIYTIDPSNGESDSWLPDLGVGSTASSLAGSAASLLPTSLRPW